jgi:hypothetical protein
MVEWNSTKERGKREREELTKAATTGPGDDGISCFDGCLTFKRPWY